MAKILIVEDEIDLAKVLAKRLMQNNFEVKIASDAYQGVALAHKEMPDLVILDLMLPAGGGLNVLKNLRKSAHTCHLPIIVVTGSQDEELKRQVREEGVDAFFLKPYEAKVVIGAIEKILNK